MAATIRDVAKKSGLSLGTVSNFSKHNSSAFSAFMLK